MGQKHQWAGSDWWNNWFKMDNVITLDDMRALRAQYLGQETTGITNPKVYNAAANGDNAWYNLSGMRIKEPTQKGIYVHNGCKIVVK